MATAVAVVRLCQVRQMLVAWPAQMRLSQPGGMWGRLGARVGGSSMEGRWGGPVSWGPTWPLAVFVTLSRGFLIFGRLNNKYHIGLSEK